MNFDSGDSRFYKKDENENLICEITYSIADSNMIVIDRTFVNDDYRGQGIAAQLVDRVVEMAGRKTKKSSLSALSPKACSKKTAHFTRCNK